MPSIDNFFDRVGGAVKKACSSVGDVGKNLHKISYKLINYKSQKIGSTLIMYQS